MAPGRSQNCSRGIRNLYSKLRTEVLSVGRIHQTHVTLNNALRVAVEDGVLPNNPCSKATVREKAKAPDIKIERFVYEQEQVETLPKTLSGWWKAFVLPALSTGMRREERLSLRWMDVDTKKNTISVVQSVTITQD